MTKKFFSLIIIISIAVSSVFAQTKQLTVEDAAWNQYFELSPAAVSQLQWIGDTYNYSYVEKWTELHSNSYNSDKDKIICTVDDINAALKTANLDEISYISSVKWLNNNTFMQKMGNLIFIYDVENKKIVQSYKLPEKAQNVEFNAKANAVAFTIDNNLQMIDSKGKITIITDESNEGIVFGTTVHRNEFGINKGIFWSEDGKSIAFYRKDETMVADYPMIDYTAFPAKATSIKYPMAGQKSEEVTLGVFDIASGKTVYMKTGTPKEQYLISIAWDPNSKFIYIGLLNRDQNHLKFNKYNSKSGVFVKTLFEETSSKYIDPQDPPFFLPKSKNKFLWRSERDGYYHYYLYNTNGDLLKQVTKGTWVVTNNYGVSADEKYMYIQSTAECAIQRHIYKVNMKNGKMDLLTIEHGQHKVNFTSDFNYFIDDYSSTDVPRNISVKNKKSKIQKQILNSDNPLTDYDLGELKIGNLKAVDGKTDLYYRMITPPNYDPTKKYPVVIYVYGGPHAQIIADRWLAGANLWFYYMAQKGYIMFTVDNRGSYNRGRDFENSTFRNLGVEEMKDQLEGVKYLKSLPFVDADRIGVHGWSYGGFMTSSMLTTYPDVFKVGVAGGTVVDWKYYEVMYGERYMDTPQDNPDGYKETSLLNKIQNLKGKLLLIHGGVDATVVPQHVKSLLLKSQELGIQLDFYEYANSAHGVGGKNGRIHLMQKITDYFDDNL